MTNPDKIKNVLTDVGKVCENCKYDGEPWGCNRPNGLCEMFDAVWGRVGLYRRAGTKGVEMGKREE